MLVPHGKPYAGKLHVRFDEGADVPCGGVSPYSTPQWWCGSGGVVAEYAIMRGMRALRNFKPDRCYHLISRIANRAFYLTDEERTRFVERLWRVAKFSGIEVLAYCFMSNHFHLLVHLPEAPELGDEELFDRIAALYSGDRLAEIRKEWEMYARLNDEAGRKRFRERFLRRMYDVSAFMKTLKQNATMSYNCRSVHTGTMWESRFRVREYMPDEKCELMNVAAYIDRNPVKAKMVKWPDRYEWCSFAAALGISSVNFFTARYLTPLAKAGYIAAVDTENLHSPQRKYRLAAKGRRLVS